MGYEYIDLFGAPGGLSLGFKLAGFEPKAAVDIDKDAIKTHDFNFPEAVSIQGDIRKISSRDLMDIAGIGKGDIDVVVGGPPCQGFSTIGRVKIADLAKKGVWEHITNHHPRFIDDPRNVLYKEFVRIVRDLQPQVIVMENVPGMMSYRNGEIVKEIIEDFSKIGYHAEARVLNAVWFGVPQIRKRIFFIGILKELKSELMWPIPTHMDPKKSNMNKYKTLDEYLGISDEKLKPPVTVWDAIGDLPDPVEGRPRLADVELDYDKPPFSKYQKWARKGSKKVHNHIARKHNERDRLTFSIMKEGDKWKDLPKEIRRMYGYRDDIFNDKFKKLRRDQPSWTITAHLHKDGYMYIHPTQPRTITVREAARLQSFPDWFIFKGSRTAQFKQVGNAVPPLLGRAVALAVKATLNGWDGEKLWKEERKIDI
ncbi:DNA cytosine methyltransferase [Palaeococcus sp. (in: euryarchaeotes)]